MRGYPELRRRSRSAVDLHQLKTLYLSIPIRNVFRTHFAFSSYKVVFLALAQALQEQSYGSSL